MMTIAGSWRAWPGIAIGGTQKGDEGSGDRSRPPAGPKQVLERGRGL